MLSEETSAQILAHFKGPSFPSCRNRRNLQAAGRSVLPGENFGNRTLILSQSRGAKSAHFDGGSFFLLLVRSRRLPHWPGRKLNRRISTRSLSCACTPPGPAAGYFVRFSRVARPGSGSFLWIDQTMGAPETCSLKMAKAHPRSPSSGAQRSWAPSCTSLEFKGPSCWAAGLALPSPFATLPITPSRFWDWCELCPQAWYPPTAPAPSPNAESAKSAVGFAA